MHKMLSKATFNKIYTTEYRMLKFLCLKYMYFHVMHELVCTHEIELCVPHTLISGRYTSCSLLEVMKIKLPKLEA